MYTVTGYFAVSFQLRGMNGAYVECTFDHDGRGKFGTLAEAVTCGRSVLLANAAIKEMCVCCVTPNRVFPVKNLRYNNGGDFCGVTVQNNPVYREEDERVVVEVERANIAARKASEAPV